MNASVYKEAAPGCNLHARTPIDWIPLAHAFLMLQAMTLQELVWMAACSGKYNQVQTRAQPELNWRSTGHQLSKPDPTSLHGPQPSIIFQKILSPLLRCFCFGF